ncbi:MAG: TadE family protein [Bryobacteraceae bacterium]
MKTPIHERPGETKRLGTSDRKTGERRTGGAWSRAGQTMVEFVFVGIPMVFVLISIFEIARGMWMYNTLAHAVREGVRYSSVHGINCVYNPPSVNNNCSKSIAQIARVIQDAGVGIDPAQTDVRFISQAGAVNCTLTGCAANSTIWPPSTSNANQVGQPIRIEVQTPFRSAIAMFWPGSKTQSFAAATFPASSTDIVQY